MCVVVAKSQGSGSLDTVQRKASQAVWRRMREELSSSAVALSKPQAVSFYFGQRTELISSKSALNCLAPTLVYLSFPCLLSLCTGARVCFLFRHSQYVFVAFYLGSHSALCSPLCIPETQLACCFLLIFHFEKESPIYKRAD